MFCIVYNKSTKHIFHKRKDSSTPTPKTSSELFQIYLKDNNATDNEFAFAESLDQFDLIVGKHVWNESTQTVEEDPNYVAPVETVEPTV